MVTSIPTTSPAQATPDNRDEADSGSTSDPDSPPEPDDSAPATARASSRPAAVVQIDRAPGVEPTIDLRWLRERLAEALALVSPPVRRVSARLVDTEQMRRQHRRFIEVDRTTDVLAFEASEAGEPIEVDLLLGADEAAREADRLGHRPEQELLLYSIHGVLHCAGFDDRTPDGFEAMHAEEDRILRAIGVGEVFSRRPARKPSARGQPDHDPDRAEEEL